MTEAGMRRTGIGLTGYLDGAVATHARIGDPWLSQTLFGVCIGVVARAALWLRSGAIRTLIPLRMTSKD